MKVSVLSPPVISTAGFSGSGGGSIGAIQRGKRQQLKTKPQAARTASQAGAVAGRHQHPIPNSNPTWHWLRQHRRHRMCSSRTLSTWKTLCRTVCSKPLCVCLLTFTAMTVVSAAIVIWLRPANHGGPNPPNYIATLLLALTAAPVKMLWLSFY